MTINDIKELNKQGKLAYFFAGGVSIANENLLMETQCWRLQSYATEKNNILRRIKAGHKTFIDSGAYSASTKGLKINVDDYIEFVNQYDDHIVLFCCWDCIPVPGVDPEYSASETWKNYLYMRERVKSPDKLLYVWHCGEDTKWLKQALDFEPKLGYMALGGLVGKSPKQRDACMKQCFDTIKESKNPDIMVHAFGMSNRKLLDKYPFSSADSTSWLQPSRFGKISANDFRTYLVSERQLDNPEHVLNLPKQIKDIVLSDIHRFKFNVQDVINSPDARKNYQVLYWQDFYENFIQSCRTPLQQVEQVQEIEEIEDLW